MYVCMYVCMYVRRREKKNLSAVHFLFTNAGIYETRLMKYDRVNENGSIAAHCFVQWNGAFTVQRNGLHSAVKLSV